MNTPYTHKGFTLIEMMVSVALFAVVVSVALPTMIVVMKASARAQALQTTIDNTSFALDSISRQVRLGTTYHCTNDPINVTVWNATTSPSYPYGTPRDCVSGASTLVFRDQNGNRQAYRYNSEEERLESWHTGAGGWVDITAPKVLIKNATFTVTGAAIYDGEPPVVTLAIRGAARDEVSVPEFTLSTNMTQYVPERGFAIRRATAGVGANHWFGSSIASVGLLDNDAVPDLLVGMSNYGSGTGGARILFMNSNGTVKTGFNITSGFGAGERVGSGVAHLSDLNGNGLREVLLGAPGFDEDTGAVYMTSIQSSGAATGTVRFVSGANGMPSIPATARFGESVARIGTRDALIGAPGANNVYLMSFTSDKTIASVSEITTSSLGLSAVDGFGSSVAYLRGDTSGNHVIAVGAASTTCGSGASCGAVYVLHVTPSGVIASSTKIESGSSNAPILSGSSRFGSSVAAGDFDRDGTIDIMVGAEEPSGTVRPGSFYILFMNSDGTLRESRQITSETNGGPILDDGDAFGSSVANIGDLNGDGRIDFAVGARLDNGSNNTSSNTGALYILFGK